VSASPRAAAAAEQIPLPRRAAARALGRSVATTVRLLLTRKTHLPRNCVGTALRFADGSTARVFRETIVDDVSTDDPCLLVVKFKLRLLRGRWHKLFIAECIANTPLFVGFPGLMSKLWLDHDESDRYRGLYEWTDPLRAERYARSLWRVLELVCERGSIGYVVVPGLRRREVLEDPELLVPFDDSGGAWWRVVGSSDSGGRRKGRMAEGRARSTHVRERSEPRPPRRVSTRP
jgi:hypothetical protein